MTFPSPGPYPVPLPVPVPVPVRTLPQLNSGASKMIETVGFKGELSGPLGTQVI